MKHIIVTLLMIYLSGAISIHAEATGYLSSYRVAPSLPESIENAILRANVASVVYFDKNIDATNNKKLLDYSYGVKKIIKNFRYEMLSSILLSNKSYIKSDYSVAMPFSPQVGVVIKNESSSYVFLFSFQSSTVRIYQNGIKMEELLIEDASSFLYIFKLLLN